MRRTAPVLALAAGLATATQSPAPAEATIIVPRTVEEMATDARAVVIGRVAQRESAWDDAHRRIHTYTEVEIVQAVHATEALPSTVVVRTMGGEVGEVGMRVAGTASFSEGEEVVLFLRADPLNAEHFQVIGMSQGKYTVDRSGDEPVAVAGVQGLAFARRGEDGVFRATHDAGGKVEPKLPLADLLARVRAAVAGTPTPEPAGPTLQTPSTPNAPQHPGSPAE